MAYQKKYKCYCCDGKGKGAVGYFATEWDKKFPDLPCSVCKGTGYNSYDLHTYKYRGKFTGVDWEKISIEYEDFTARYKCRCGGEIFFSEDGIAVCDCGRAYKLSIKLTVDETHLNDLKFWEEYKDE